MPELPEVETTRTSLFPLLQQRVQAVKVRNASLRWPIPNDLEKLVGQRLTELKRRSKYILAEFEQDHMLWHLGMSGSFRPCQPNDELKKHDHLIIDFDLLDKLNKKNVGIKIALMDNHIVVGVGNIYATESLFNIGVHPAQPASTLTPQQVEKLVVEVKRILKQAIDLGGSTLRDYSNAMGENGYFQQTLLAYGRAGEMCVNCETTLENLKLGQRASVFCPQCQPLKLNKA